MKATSNKKVIKIKNGEVTEIDDPIAVEEPLQISISVPSADPPIVRKNIAITMRTPTDDKSLALGFLYTEGILRSADQIGLIKEKENSINLILKDINVSDLTSLERNFYTSSSCGICGKASIDSVKQARKFSKSKFEFSVSPELLATLPDKLWYEQSIFQSTGAIHASALFDLDGNLISTSEDVGRHNALDKLIGKALLDDNLPLDQNILVLSGRASFELLQKAMMAGIQFVAAVGAPSSLAIDLAIEFDMTLVGFLKDQRFNIYHGAKRVTI